MNMSMRGKTKSVLKKSDRSFEMFSKSSRPISASVSSDFKGMSGCCTRSVNVKTSSLASATPINGRVYAASTGKIDEKSNKN